MSETDLPVLAALADVTPPPADSTGARFLRAAWATGRRAVPERDEDVWTAWVDLALWRRPTANGPVDLTAHARAALEALADGLADAVPDPVPAPAGGARSGLTSDQDARLRTLAALRELGELSPELQQLRRSYRERDQRAVVRAPDPVTWPAPGELRGPA